MTRPTIDFVAGIARDVLEDRQIMSRDSLVNHIKNSQKIKRYNISFAEAEIYVNSLTAGNHIHEIELILPRRQPRLYYVVGGAVLSIREPINGHSETQIDGAGQPDLGVLGGVD